MARILVTDGEHRAALAIVRSLGRAGHDVLVCSSRRRSLAGASRYCRRQTTVPDPLGASDAYAAAVANLLDQTHADVLLPVTDASLLALLPLRERRPHLRIPFPPEATFRRAADKPAVLETARTLGIAVPAQRCVASAGEGERLDPGSFVFPLVVKPARSVGDDGTSRTKAGVRYAADAASLPAALHAVPTVLYPVLLQQRIAGPGLGVFFLLDDQGRPVARFAHRRLREKPPSGGVSVYCESIEPPAGLFESSLRLLRALQWRGVAMVEYKLDAATGIPHLMEINGRFWGSLQLAIDAGVDFPALLVRLALGERPDPVLDYRLTVRERWWWGDVDHLLARLRRSAVELQLPTGAPGRWRAVGDFLRASLPAGGRNEVLRRDDPLPFLRESLDWLRGR